MRNLASQRLRPALLALGACLLTNAPLVASPTQGKMSDSEVRAEIAFARGLASSWSLVDLAQEVIAKLETSNLSGALAEEVNLLKCEVYFVAARSDAKNRETLLKNAIDSYSAFLSRATMSDESKAAAEAGLVEASSAYARTMVMRLEDTIGDEADQLRQQIQDVLQSGAKKAGDLVQQYQAIPRDEITDAQRRKLYELLLARGEMLLEMAKTQEDGTANFARARSSFESLSDSAGEGTPWSLRAFIGIGDVYAAEGKPGEAAAFYEFAVNFSIPLDRAAWAEAVKVNQMTLEEKQARFLFVQLGTPGLVKSLLAQGDTQAALEWSLHLHNTWRREGLDLLQPYGYLALLEVARGLVDIGGVIGGNTSAGEAAWYATSEDAAAAGVPKRSQRTALDFALSLAQTVSNDNKGTTLLVRAQQVIGEIISRPGVQVDPTVLFDAAQGDFNASEFDAAIPEFKRVLMSLESSDQATRAEMMPKVLWHLGRCYARLDRQVEAAVIYEHALDSWTGDAIWDEQNAVGFNSAMGAIKRQARDDALVTQLVQKSEQLLARFSESSANTVLFRGAEKLFDEKKYGEARAKYKLVTAGNEVEKAMVALGLCDYREGKFDAAIAIFRDYLEKFVPDAKNATNDPQKLAKRKEARATATFYWGLSLYKKAEAGNGDWNAVVQRLSDYPEQFPEQTSYGAVALYQTLMAYVNLQQQKDVRAVLERMLQLFPDDRYTGEAAKASYEALEKRRNEETDEAKRKVLLREMAENLQTLNRTSPKPSFINLRRESVHWVELAEWATAEEVLKRIRTVFGMDPTYAADMPKFVLPDLGVALMRQYKVQEAADVIVPLMALETPKATRDTARNYVRVVSGWVELPDLGGGKYGNPKEVPGVGEVGKAKDAQGKENPRSFEAAAIIVNQLASTDKWTTEWFGYKFDQTYLFHQWSKLDSKQAEHAKSTIDYLANPTNLGTQFRHEQMPEDLRQLYVWLYAQIGR